MKKGLTVVQAKRFEVISCVRRETLGDAVRRMVEDEVSALVVVDDEGCLAGIITRTDVLRAYIALDDWQAHPVEEYMVREVVTVDPEARLLDVAELLLRRSIHRVVVVRKEEGRLRPVSVVSSADLLYHMAKDA